MKNDKYIIKISWYGHYPGSPDHDYYSVDEKTYETIFTLLRPFNMYDTLEDALICKRKKKQKG